MTRFLLLVLLGVAAVWPAAALDLSAMSEVEIAGLQRRLADAGCYQGAVDGVAGRGTQGALDECPLMDPMLRIEAGRHTALVRSLDVSADESRLVTGSDDKTVRLWHLPDGKLERVLRVPVGGGEEGKVNAVALSPDGTIVAAAGWITPDAGDEHVYLFDAATGEVVRRLGPLPPAVVDKLAFSGDGRRLAVGMGGGGGVLVFDPVTGHLTFGDVDYGANVYGVAFDHMGRLAVISFDGEVRLYDAAGKRIAVVKAPGGQRPFCVAFSPDGSRLAIGYQDTTRLDVLDGSTLAPLFSPDTSGIDDGYFAAVAFSADGTMLYAGGSHGLDEEPVFAFADGGSGARRELTGRPDTIFDLVPFGERGVIFSSGEPAIGLLDDSGERVLELLPVAADMRGKRFEHFTVSADAARVRFDLGYRSDPVVFDVSSLALDDSPTPEPGLRQTDTTSLSVEDWQGMETPTLDGNALAILQYEFARSLAVLPGDPPPGFLLGADWSLYRFEAGGKNNWRIDVPAAAWGLNLSQNGDIAVVAYGDGTIRWQRTWDGAELLALFVHALDRRWVAWTPSGYYAASPGGEDLIGWHLNRGWEQAPDFFPASRLRDRFYRPDIVQAVLSNLDEELAVEAANAAGGIGEQTIDVASALPPVVALSAPPGDAFSKATLTLAYQLRSPSGQAITGVDVLLDGRPIATGRGLARIETAAAGADDAAACPVFEGARGLMRVEASEPDLVAGLSCSVTLTLPPRDVEISLVARAGELVSEASTLLLVYGGAEAPSEAEPVKPKLYALVVGVSDYEIDRLRLSFAAQDARDMATALGAQTGGLYREVEVRLLADRDATSDAILEGLEWLEAEVKDSDVGLLFLAGHGVTDERQRFFYLPADGDPEKLRSTAVSGDDIQETIGSLAGKALFFIDACHSGASFRESRGLAREDGAADITSVINVLSAPENGIVMFASSTGREVSIERPEWANGAFTEALLEGLSGGADFTKDGNLTVAELDLWLSERVKALTELEQHAVVRRPDTVPDFPIALVRQ